MSALHANNQIGRAIKTRYSTLITIVMLLVLTPFAGADIVWSGNWDQPPTSDPFPNLDIDENGTDDFYVGFDEIGYTGWILEPLNDNYGIAGIAEPSLLDAGVIINASTSGRIVQGYSEFLLEPTEGGVEGTYYIGACANTNGYLGLAFEVDGATHYGWISISHSTNRPVPLNGLPVVHSWAWESDPDTPIVTGAIPEPTSVMLMIVGAGGLWMARRRRFR